MRLGYCAITWGGIVGTAGGVGSIADLYYTANGDTLLAVREIANAGYAGVEVFDGDLLAYADRPDDLLEVLRDCGLELASVYTGANFIYDDIAADEFAKITRAAELGRRFGATTLVLGGGAQRSGGPQDGDIARLGRGLEHASRIAADQGLQASYHPHLGTLVETPEALDELMSASDIRFCPDTGHLAAGGGDPAAIIRRYADRLAHVHLKDWRASTGTFQALGEGDLDVGDILDAALDGGYDGWFMVELDSYDGAPREAARISKRLLDRLLHDRKKERP